MEAARQSPWLRWIAEPKWLLILYVLFALAASVQSYLLPDKQYVPDGKSYARYNNYVIFRNSFHHLKDQKDLYAYHEEEQWDLYKYSPSFAAFFGAFAIFPDLAGLSLWNLLNALALLLGIYALPGISRYNKGLAALFCLIELLTSMQNQQSNALIAGLLLYSYASLEKQRWSLAALCIVFSVYIKIFGMVGFALYLFYYRHWWKLIFHTLLWSVLLFLLPFLFVDANQYRFLMESWLHMLSEDHSASLGLSVMGWLESWFGLTPDKMVVVLAGVLLFCLPLLRFRSWKLPRFRQLTLASVLLWIVIFNHKAESPTFVIAVAGVFLWYLNSRRKTGELLLLLLCLLFTSLSSTDLFPPSLRQSLVVPYVLKAVPCIVVWGVLLVQQMRLLPEESGNRVLT